MAPEHTDSAVGLFENALVAILDVVPAPRAIAVAYSGGLDSSVLLHLAHDFARAHGLTLHAFHVHHGLSEHADDWLDHCRDTAARLEVVFAMRRVAVNASSGDGIESSARRGRYAALGEMCREHAVPLVLTAHHQDDQAETVLLQLLRGSGVAGLSGMDQANHATDLLGDASIWMGRPMLAVSRAALQAFATSREIAHVEDPSNQDARFARNALRHEVMPVLEARFPGFAERFARTARHAQSAQQLLIELAVQDMAECANGDGDTIDIDRLRMMSDARSDNLLRYWFGSRGMRMPSTAWLRQMRSQLLSAKPDAQILISHADCDIHRHRNRIMLTPRRALADPEHDPEQDIVRFTWTGNPQMHFPTFGGTLHFMPAEPGIDGAWLRSQVLSIGWRSGGWRLKPAPNRPTRSLKYHYQAADIPAWERTRLPLVTTGKQLLFAAGIGMDCQHFAEHAVERIGLHWEPDSA